jgi:hypothetical protein
MQAYQTQNKMGYFRKTLERRTFSQDRYYILIKKQKAGTAKLDELVELDEIVNRVPDIREKVIMENFMTDDPENLNTPNDNHKNNDEITIQQAQKRNLWNRIGTFLHRVFIVYAADTETGPVTPVF